MEFLDAIEEPLKEELLPLEKGKTIYTSLLGTAPGLAPEENVKVIWRKREANGTSIHLKKKAP